VRGQKQKAVVGSHGLTCATQRKRPWGSQSATAYWVNVWLFYRAIAFGRRRRAYLPFASLPWSAAVQGFPHLAPRSDARVLRPAQLSARNPCEGPSPSLARDTLARTECAVALWLAAPNAIALAVNAGYRWLWALLVLVATGLRLPHPDWDGGIAAHPDERYLLGVCS
jgi:hypothetical protein